ncbi:MAG: hypothetical protein ACPLSM_03745 [Thermosphaera sp.]
MRITTLFAIRLGFFGVKGREKLVVGKVRPGDALVIYVPKWL